MRKLFAVALPAGLAILLAAWLVSSLRTRSEAADARVERARVKREFTERAALARALPVEPLADWQAEVLALSRGYFEALAAARSRYPGAPAAPGALAAAEAEKKNLSAKDRDAILDFQKYAEGRFALLRDGSYAPVASAHAAGLRLDLVAIEPGASPQGGPGLRVDFALWGAPRLLERERSGDKTVTRTFVPVSFRRIAFRFLDPAGKLYGEMTGGGEPWQKLTDPERFVDDFPPGVLFGTWWVELLPREAARTELTLDVDVRGATGSSRPATFQVALPVAESWKVPPGTAYQAEIRTVPAEPGKP